MTALVPNHIAIIMDGNGRWAQKRGHPRVFGHIRGSKNVKPILKEAKRLGAKALTVYAFSTENWSRPDAELSVLWKLLKKFLIKERQELKREGVRLGVIGEIHRLNPELQETLKQTIEYLADGKEFDFVLSLSYGSRRELALAAKNISKDVLDGKITPDQVDEKLMERYLWTSYLGDLANVDLLIRTSGEKRISNFLLWQSAYTEFIFTEVSWPDFSPKHLAQAVADFGKRERRYGGLK